MSIVTRMNPFDFFTDTAGDALDEGYIWIGVANQDPRQFPVSIYYDSALTIPAAMPLRTSSGYVVRNGSPTFLYGNGNYSILVQNKRNEQIYYVADFLMVGNSGLGDISGAMSIGNPRNVADARLLPTPLLPRTAPYIVTTAGYYTVGDGGHASYRFDLTDITSADDGVLVLVTTSGARLKLIYNGTIDSAQGGCSTTLPDNSARFNATSAAVASFGGKMTIQTGELTFTQPITLRNGVIYEGRGVKIDGNGTKFTYTGTLDFCLIQNPINGSTSANIEISGIWFNSSTVTVDNGLLFDTGSSVVVLKRCRFNSSGVGLILDQSELWDISYCSFLCSTATATGVWLVNGADKNPTAQSFFTNRIAFLGCEWNGSAGSTAVSDDGGTAHAFRDCNFNACGTHIRACTVNGLIVDGGEYEISSAQMIILNLTKRKGAASSASSMVTINGVFFFNSANLTVIACVTAAVTNLRVSNNIVNTPAANVPFTGFDTGPVDLIAELNVQVGAGLGGATINNRVVNASAIIGWTSTGTQPAIGNGLVAARYDREGSLLTFRFTLQAGSTTTYGTGNYVFTLPISINSTTELAQVGAAWLLIPGSGFFACVARVIPGTNTVMVYATNGNNVGPTVPATWVSGTQLEFQVKCNAALPI